MSDKQSDHRPVTGCTGLLVRGSLRVTGDFSQGQRTPQTWEMKAAVVVLLPALVALLQVFKVSEAADPTSKPVTVPKCQNGGVYDGIKCVCTGNMIGALCENVNHTVFIGKEANTSMTVELTVTGYRYNANLSDPASEQYKEFEKQFIATMFSILSSNIDAVRILELKPSGTNDTFLRHELLMVIQYNNNISIIEQYEARYQQVVDLLKTASCETGALCIDGNSVSPRMDPPKSEQELCAINILPAFIKYFDPETTGEGLYCLSNCEPKSQRYYDCTIGSCQIQESGPICFCPKTDEYVYTYSRCRGPVLLAAIYGGVGAAIAVLLIILVVLAVCLYRKKHYY